MAETNSDTSNLADTIASAISRSKTSVEAMLSHERAQKLDLLVHLITNLKQSLILCGPEGIGKTTLLENIQERNPGSWLIYSEIANSGQSFESLQSGLQRHLQQHDHQFENQSIDEILNRAEQNHQKIVFIVDEAGKLIPGLINSICQYANNFPALRVILALTPDELHVKNSSDSSADDCHFIELPPLTEDESGVFLKNLSGKPGATFENSQINSSFISKIYRETSGIPGKIVAIQANPVTTSNPEYKQWLSMAAVGIVVATVISLFLWGDDEDQQQLQAEKVSVEPRPEQMAEEKTFGNTSQQKQAENISDLAALSPISPEVVAVEIIPPVIDKQTGLDEVINQSIDLAENDFNAPGADPLDLKNLQDAPQLEIQDQQETPGEAEESKNTETVENTESSEAKEIKPVIPEAPAITEDSSASPIAKSEQTIKTADLSEDKKPKLISEPEPEPEPEAVKPQKKVNIAPKPAPTKALLSKKQSSQGKEWVLKQKPGKYSLQLMAIAKDRKSALTKILNKHPDLQGQLHYFLSTKKGKENYVLLFGSFAKLDEAKQAIKKLPKAFGKPWLRSFKMLQKDIKSN